MWKYFKTGYQVSLVLQWLGICLPVQGTQFDPWSERVPHAVGQLGLEPHLRGPRACLDPTCSAGEATAEREACAPRLEQPPVLCTQRKSAGSGKDPVQPLKTLKSSRLSYKQQAIVKVCLQLYLTCPPIWKQAGPKHPSPSSSLECVTVPNTQLALSKSW